MRFKSSKNHNFTTFTISTEGWIWFWDHVGSWNKIWHKSTKSGQVDPWTICMKMQIKRNLMNILEKWASAPDFLIQESFQFWFQLPTSITCNLQSIFSDFYGTWGLELGGRLGSAGHDPVLVYFFNPFLTWKCSKKDAKWATDAKRYGFHNWIFNSKEDHNFLSNSKSQILAKTREQIVRNSDKIVTKDIKMI